MYHIRISDELLVVMIFLASFLAAFSMWLSFNLVLLKRQLRPRRASRLGFYVRGKRIKYMNLKVSQQVSVAVVAEDKFGNPTGAFDAAPAWSLSDPSLGDVQVAADGLSALVVPNGKLGSCQLQVLAKADGKDLAGSLDLVLIAGDATQIVLQAGVPVDQPAPSA